MAFIPRVQLPSGLAGITAQLRAQLAEIIPRAITSAGESLGRGLEARGRRKFKQRQTIEARTAGREDVARQLTAQLGIGGQLNQPSEAQPEIGFSTGQLESVLGLEKGFLGVDKPIVRKPLKAKEPEKPGAKEARKVKLETAKLDRDIKTATRDIKRLELEEKRTGKPDKKKGVTIGNLLTAHGQAQGALLKLAPQDPGFAEAQRRVSSIRSSLTDAGVPFDELERELTAAQKFVEGGGSEEEAVKRLKAKYGKIPGIEDLFKPKDKKPKSGGILKAVLSTFGIGRMSPGVRAIP